MSVRDLGRLFAAYAAVLAVVLFGTRAWFSLEEVPEDQAIIVESSWREGVRVARSVRPPGSQPSAGDPGVTVVEERVVGRGPLLRSGALFALGIVPGRDGIAATLRGETVYATIDDLLRAQAYDRASTFLDPSLGLGVHRAVAMHVLAEQLRAPAGEVEANASFARVRFARRVVGAEPALRVTGATLERALVLDAVRAAAHHLARSVDEGGRFRYLVDATTNVTLPGYNWPRHAGATFFLAQSAAALDDPVVRYAALRAAARLRDDTMVACGAERCVTDWDEADVGSSALSLIAFTELVRTGADASYAPAVRALASFLRSQQRADGELMHVFDRRTGKPRDVQYLYFTGEAALALARAHTVTADARDLDGARRALAHLVERGWSFFGSRYYWSEEHWTCQALDELWERAPSPDALAFCLRWHEFQRSLQQADGDAPFDADGAFGAGPVVTPRLTPAASRAEAAGATLAVLRRMSADGRAGGAARREDARLADELERAVAFLLRHQLVAGRAPTHLLGAPDAVRGAFPGSAVDLQLRVDYAQHAGSALLRWLELTR